MLACSAEVCRGASNFDSIYKSSCHALQQNTENHGTCFVRSMKEGIEQKEDKQEHTVMLCIQALCADKIPTCKCHRAIKQDQDFCQCAHISVITLAEQA